VLLLIHGEALQEVKQTIDLRRLSSVSHSRNANSNNDYQQMIDVVLFSSQKYKDHFALFLGSFTFLLASTLKALISICDKYFFLLFLAQTEGDTGYDYNDAYDDSYDDDSGSTLACVLNLAASINGSLRVDKMRAMQVALRGAALSPLPLLLLLLLQL
jgi:hypothetical protein